MDLIGYVSQDNFLFNVSVRENIRMGRPEATDDEVEAVAKASGCHEFIMGLDHGYDTVVGGAGGHLSGGERQRVAIARAMMKNAPIVILDEATSYTDPENEAVLQDAIGRLTRGKTLIVIAHRLSTITDADQIAVVDQGKILDAGTHEGVVETVSPLRSDVGGPHAGEGCGYGRRRWQACLTHINGFSVLPGSRKALGIRGMAFELLRSIFEALQFAALLIVLRALVEQNMTGATHGWLLGS